MITPKRIVVSILDEQLHLITDEDERVIHKASRTVEDVFREVQYAANGGDVPHHHISLLSALRISLDSLLRSQQLTHCQERIAILNNVIDDALKSLPPKLSS